MGWTYKHRQLRKHVHAEFLAETGRDEFDAKAFLDWLRDRPEHEAYPLFF